MNIDEFNQTIKNYIVNDKSQRALMMTAPWGSGKSYYIKNHLCPYLKSLKLDYALVSLYGISSLNDISKNIYLEIRAKKIIKKSESTSASLLIGKTIVKGIASFFNVDLNQSERDLQKLYRSIELSNKLIILEDLERSSIDIVEILGFVNNLVEQDGAKVLLVANEEDILKIEDDNKNGKIEKRLNKKSLDYLKIKEKTIGDTLHYTSNIIDTIGNIVGEFNNPIFNEMLLEKDNDNCSSLSRRIYQQMLTLNCFNFRSLLYACQKIDEILYKNTNKLNINFAENLLIGTIIYSIRVNGGGSKSWDSQTIVSQTLGSYAYPLYKVAYDYIEYHLYDWEDFKNSEMMFLHATEISKTDEELNVLFNYYDSSESEIENIINSILIKLNKDSGLVHNEYVKIANYLIAIKHTVGFKELIDACLEKMLINAKKAIDNGEKINTFATSGIQLETNEQISEFNNLINEINNYQKNSKILLNGFNYDHEKIFEFYDFIVREKRNFINERGFINKFDVIRLIEMLGKSSSKEIHCFRSVLHYIYFSFTNIKDYFICDLEDLKKFREEINSTNFPNGKMDKIQMLQLNYLKGNIDEIIFRLEA